MSAQTQSTQATGAEASLDERARATEQQMTDDERFSLLISVLGKFLDCASRALEGGAPEQVVAAVDGLDRAPDLAALTGALRAVRRRG